MIENDLIIIFALILVSVPCALLGAFLSFQRKALLSDAISHSLLGGIGLAFVVFGSKALPLMLLGAIVSGLATAIISQKLSEAKKLPYDTALGTVFPVFFSLGVLLISWSASDVDIDPGCILYGLVEFIPLDTLVIFGAEVPRAYLSLVPVFLIVMSGLFIFRKEIKVSIFDQEFAKVAALNPRAINMSLIIFTSAVIVVGFEAVGSILVISLLVAPSATAGFLTNSYRGHLIISVLLSIFSALAGYFLAVDFNTTIAGMVSVVHGTAFIAAIFLSPKEGFLAKLYRKIRLGLRISSEDTLADLYRRQEENASIKRYRKVSLYQSLLTYIADQALLQKKLVTINRAGDLAITKKGVEKGRRLVRAHRLWETYLSRNLQLPEDHLHDPAERMEHYLSELMTEELASELGAKVDPHGRKIPVVQ